MNTPPNQTYNNTKFCTHCGAQIHPDAVVCVHCGCNVASAPQNGFAGGAPAPAQDSTLQTVIKVFLIIGCIAQGWTILPLAWCLPITISVFNCMRDRRPIGTGLKVCSLLFVNMIAGICMLCSNDL